MKKYSLLQLITLVFLSTLFLFSCKKDDIIEDEDTLFEQYDLIQEVTQDNHSLQIYADKKVLHNSYHKLFFKIVDENEKVIAVEDFEWSPEMHMTNMNHGGPFSEAEFNDKIKGYETYAIFQMAGNEEESWYFNFTYNIEGQDYDYSTAIEVKESHFRKVSVFQGADDQRYILAFVNPQDPKVGMNTMETYVYKMTNMYQFDKVDNYTIKIDPRMPGMGNHSSPNNTDLVQEGNDIYTGKLNLSMTGYWKINLQLWDANNNLLKGEEVTEEQESSSIYFEIEF